MIKRNLYLDKIRDFYNETSLIKIIYGLRRSGKSVILTQVMDELIDKGVNENHIIYMNFESLEYSFIKNAEDKLFCIFLLHALIRQNILLRVCIIVNKRIIKGYVSLQNRSGNKRSKKMDAKNNASMANK